MVPWYILLLSATEIYVEEKKHLIFSSNSKPFASRLLGNFEDCPRWYQVCHGK